MRGKRLTFAFLPLILLVPAPAGPGASTLDDPYAEVVEALAQGRHWYARRLLAQLDRSTATEPAALLLTARADAGRGTWTQVVRRLNSARWLDSIDFGDGRALLARALLETERYEDAIEHYDAFLSYSVEREPRALAEIGRGRALDGLGRSEAAAAAFSRATELLPELQPWLAIRAAESLAPSGDTANVHRYLNLAADIPAWRSARALAEAYYSAGARSRAVATLARAANRRGAPARSAELRLRASEMLLEAADTAAARRLLRTSIRATPRSAREAADLLVQLPGLRASDHLYLARSYEGSGARSRAVRHYREYMSRARLSRADRRSLQMKVGTLLFKSGAYTAAIDQLETLVASRPPRALAARAEYYIARSTYRRGLRGGGRARLRDVADRFPGTASAINALVLLADVYEGAGNQAAAQETYEELARKYPWTQSAGRARFRLGILAYLDGDYASARRHFDHSRQAFRRPEQRTQSTYWAARAREAEGDSQSVAGAKRLFRQTHARDPFGYYGLLAAERVDIDPWENLATGPEPSPIDAATEHKFETIELLREAGLTEETELVLNSILSSRPRRPEDLLGLSYALAERGFGEEAVRFGWRAHARLKGRWSVNVLRGIYPLPYSEILLAESRHHRVDPHLLAAVVRQESAFSPDVVSRAGARGLLQIMPGTGRWWATRLGVRDYTDDLLFHPETNVHLGAAFLSDLQRRYRELQISLAAYNAGPTRARRWVQSRAYRVDPEIFAERIPFSETRGYVRNIQTQLRIYRQLYTEFGTSEATD